MDPTTAATAANTATSILSDRSDAMIILVLGIACFAVWMWKIHIPRMDSQRKLQEADKEIHRTNSETLAKLSEMTTGIHQTATHSCTTLEALAEIKEIELNCIACVAEKAQCDLREPLAEARGVLRAVRAGVTE